MAEYIATHETGVQITEDSFIAINPTLKINDSTTIGQIKKWYAGEGRSVLMQVKIIELEELPAAQT